MLGLPSLLSEGAKQLDTSRVVNILHQLLQLHRHHLKVIDELKDRYTFICFSSSLQIVPHYTVYKEEGVMCNFRMKHKQD